MNDSRDYFQERLGDYRKRYDTVWLQAKSLIELARCEKHCMNVEANLGTLLSIFDSEKVIPPKVIAVLSIAAILHDGGKAVTSMDHAAIMAKKLQEDDMLRNALFGDDRILIDPIIDVIKVHDSGNIIEVKDSHSPGGPPPVLTPFIASLFRLADMLDFTSERCCWAIPFLTGEKPSDKYYARFAMSGWRIGDNNTIVIETMSGITPYEHDAVVEAIGMMNESMKDKQIECLRNFKVISKNQKPELLAFPYRFLLDKPPLNPPLPIPNSNSRTTKPHQLPLYKSTKVKTINESEILFRNSIKSITTTEYFLTHVKPLFQQTEIEDCKASCIRLIFISNDGLFEIKSVALNSEHIAGPHLDIENDGVINQALQYAYPTWYPENDKEVPLRNFEADDERLSHELAFPIIAHEYTAGVILLQWTQERWNTLSSTETGNIIKRINESIRKTTKEVQGVLDRIFFTDVRRPKLQLRLDRLLEHTSSDRGYFALFTKRGSLEYIMGGRDTDKFLRLHATEGLCGRAFFTGETQNIKDVSDSEEAIVSDPLILSELVMPIKFNDIVVGVINVEKSQPYEENDVDLLSFNARQIAQEYDNVAEQILLASFSTLVASENRTEPELLNFLRRATCMLLRKESIGTGPIIKVRDLFEEELESFNDDVVEHGNNLLFPLRINGIPAKLLEVCFEDTLRVTYITKDSIIRCVQTIAIALARIRSHEQHDILYNFLAAIHEIRLEEVDITLKLKHFAILINNMLGSSFTTIFWRSPIDTHLIIPGVSTEESLFVREEGIVGYRDNADDQGITGYVFQHRTSINIPNIQRKETLEEGFDPQLVWRGRISENIHEGGNKSRPYLACSIIDSKTDEYLGLIRCCIEDKYNKPRFSKLDESILSVITHTLEPLLKQVIIKKLKPTVNIECIKEEQYQIQEPKPCINQLIIGIEQYCSPQPVIEQKYMPPQLIGYTFYDKEIKDAYDQGKLLSIRLETGMQCNSNCIYCCNDSGEMRIGTLPYEKQIDVIAQAKDMGAKSVVFIGGGEFLLYRKWKDLLIATNKYGLIPVVFTNGMSIDESVSQLLYENNGTVILKLDSLRSDVQFEMSGKKMNAITFQTAYDQLIKAGFDKISNLGQLRLGVSCVATKKNKSDVVDVWKYARMRNLFPNIEWLIPNGRAAKDNALMLDFDEIDDLRNMLYRNDSETFGYEWVKYTPRIGGGCLQFLYSIYITHDGYTRPCASIHYKGPNVKESSLINILNTEFFDVARHPKQHIEGKCGNCEFNYHCFGCRGFTYTYYKRSGLTDISALCQDDPTCSYIPKGR